MGKIRIIIFLLLALLISFSIYFLAIKFYVDPYLENYSDLNRAPMLFEFYEKEKEADKVYYWGASSIKEDVDANIIDDLDDSFTHYNLGNPASTPLRRIAELEAAIKSKPKAVVIGLGYMSLSGHWLFPDDQYALISKYVDLRDLTVYNETYRELLGKNKLELLIYKRKFINPATDNNFELLKHAVFKAKKPGFYKKYNSDFKSEGILLQFEELQDPEFAMKLEAKEDFNEYSVPEGENSEKLAFEIIVKELLKNKIKVIIVKIPLNPGLVEKIPEEYKNNFDVFLDEVSEQYDVEVIDYTLQYNESYFYDGHHLNVNGKEVFSKELGLEVIKTLEP
ncbi:hypothetical protein CMO88_00960 [Candidatus Woesearchaeota archaeon]|nr:hypothetical protein [Candidatus Woesearchaeota archaeon]|tara:strand:- start:536 stop:1546 length:1011 start_codon:yes stop_codon:yes gene_type:complete